MVHAFTNSTDILHSSTQSQYWHRANWCLQERMRQCGCGKVRLLVLVVGQFHLEILDSACVQTINLPAISIWCACILENQDLVVGANDGQVRIFTRERSRVAPDALLQTFNQSISRNAISRYEMTSSRFYLCEAIVLAMWIKRNCRVWKCWRSQVLERSEYHCGFRKQRPTSRYG